MRQGVSGWSMHVVTVPGRPDFYFPRQKAAVFVDGCFWHGCPRCGHVPGVRRAFWKMKIRRNRERDAATARFLQSQKVSVVRIWEHELAGRASNAVLRIRQALKKRARYDLDKGETRRTELVAEPREPYRGRLALSHRVSPGGDGKRRRKRGT